MKIPLLASEQSEDSDYSGTFKYIIGALESFRPQTLREVTVVFIFWPLQAFILEFLPSAPELRAELEKTLTAFPQPAISFSPLHRVNCRRYYSWMPMLERFFPALAERGALTMNAESCGSHNSYSAVESIRSLGS